MKSSRSPSLTSVCLVNPTYLMRRPISELARILQEKGYKVSVLTPQSKTTKSLHHTHNLKKVAIHTYDSWRAPIGFEWPIPNPFSFFPTVRTVLREHKNIQMWTHSYLSCLGILLYAKFYSLVTGEKRNVIFTLDTIPGKSFKFNSWIDYAYTIFNETIGYLQLAATDSITLYSKQLLQFIPEHLHKKTKITPTGVNSKFFDTKTTIKTPKKKPIVFVGLVSKRKGIDRLIEIAKQLPQEQFIVAGDGPERSSWQELSPSNVKYLGKIKNVKELLQSARCLLLPSRAEGLAGIIMEAMILQCPVVTSKILCTTDLIEDKKEGFLVKEDNIGGYVQAIQTIKNQPGQAKKMASAANQKVLINFSWQKNLKRFTEVYV